ncbi:MAG: hypothetical protein RSB41_00460 [Bacilli bacterium]
MKNNQIIELINMLNPIKSYLLDNETILKLIEEEKKGNKIIITEPIKIDENIYRQSIISDFLKVIIELYEYPNKQDYYKIIEIIKNNGYEDIKETVINAQTSELIKDTCDISYNKKPSQN